MCGIASYIGLLEEEGRTYVERARELLQHRGPDDFGIFETEGIALLHRRLSILELTELGHQPMRSACGRYYIIFNGEIYNHLELRKQFLPEHIFKGHSDTETVIALFSLMQEQMLQHMVGMWAIVIWDTLAKKAFVSRDRFGQKPIYLRKHSQNGWLLSSEIKPLLQPGERIQGNATAIVEYLALGNYGHLGSQTFYKDIQHFPQGHYAWIDSKDTELHAKPYWVLPNIRESDKIPFDESVRKQLHNLIVEGILSQTLADVPIGLTLSGGIDSSIIAGILAAYYDKELHIFTAQTPNSKYDETVYVDAVLKRFNNKNLFVHRNELNQVSIKDELAHYIGVQEEPFGDPSIIAHGTLMNMAANAGIKVILNGQGADEVFFGYNNMAQAILMQQFKSLKFAKYFKSLNQMKLGKRYMIRTLIQVILPKIEKELRTNSRSQRRNHIVESLLSQVDERSIHLATYDNIYDVWKESIYGVHLPHLVHYDDRNGMSRSLEGRMPFLDHRIAEFVATLQPESFLKSGLRKYILRETCKEYLPTELYQRTDKVGFFTPLIDMLVKDKVWVADQMASVDFIKDPDKQKLLQHLKSEKMDVAIALHIWRQLCVKLWTEAFNVSQ